MVKGGINMYQKIIQTLCMIGEQNMKYAGYYETPWM